MSGGDMMNPEGVDTSDLSSQNLEAGAVDDRPPLEEPVERATGSDPDIAPETPDENAG
jgi:hypothetical protein